MTILYWIFEIAYSFIENYLCFKFCDIFTPTKNNISLKISISIIITALITILNTFSLVVSPVCSLIMVISAWIFQCFYRQRCYFKLIFIVLMYYTVVLISDMISLLTVGLITQTDNTYMAENVSPERTLMGIFSKVTLILIVTLLEKLILKDKTSSRKADIIFSVSTFIVTLILTIIYLTFINSMDSFSKPFLLGCFIIMLFMILTIFIALEYIRNIEHKKQELSLIEQQNNMLKKSLEEQEEIFLSWKKSIHDYKHKMIALEGMLESERYDEALESVKTELNTFRNKAFYISTGNISVDILLNNKMNIAKSNGIVFTFNVDFSNEPKISDIHLSVILGNLIDNAIEAATKETNEKYVHIQISQVKELLVIKILNSYSADKISNKSTKENPELHGIGLKSVEHIVDKYNGSFSIELKDKCVIALVTI